jgi:hypothetical protein
MNSNTSIIDSEFMRECANSSFEILIVEMFKEICTQIKRLDERLTILEDGGK